jgi:hypothetical protein
MRPPSLVSPSSGLLRGARGRPPWPSPKRSATADASLTNLGRIARYDTLTTTWHALPNQGLNGWVNALALSGSDLYVGGYFWQTGDGALALSYIARYGAYHQVCLPLLISQ